MGLESFLKKTALDPLKRMADDALNKFTRELTSKFENEVDKLFTKGLKSLGLSNSIASKLAARFGDALVNELADEFFQSASSEANRLSKKDICDNFAPRFAATATQSVDRITYKLKDVAGVGSDSVKQFPSVLGKYYMSLKFREYTRTAPFAKMDATFKNAINLPIPRSLEDAYNIDIQTKNLGGVGAATDLAMAYDKNSNFDVSSQAGAFGLMFANKITESVANKVSSGAGTAVTDVGGQLLGTIPNPHVAAIFQGINLKEHTFEWTFAPRNQGESAALREVILTLQQNSLPAYSQAGTAALEYPYLCQIDLYPWANGDTPLIPFKPAMLKNVVINYSPNGIPSFFAGTNLPTFVSLKLTFIETEYFTSNDYGRQGRADSKVLAMAEKGEEFIGAVINGLTGSGSNTANQTAQADNGGAPPPAPATRPPAPAPVGQITTAQLASELNSLTIGSRRRISNYNQGEGVRQLNVGRTGSGPLDLTNVVNAGSGTTARIPGGGRYYAYIEIPGEGRTLLGDYATAREAYEATKTSGAIK